jgi:hypothetical protein
MSFLKRKQKNIVELNYMKNFKSIVILFPVIAVASFLFFYLTEKPEKVLLNDKDKLVHDNPLKKTEDFEQSDTKLDLKGSENLKIETEEVFITTRELKSTNEQGFSKSYKLLAEVPLDKTGKNVRLILDKPIEEVYSLVFIGGVGEGESEIKGLLLNGESSSEASKSLEDRYFENDWKKFDQIDNKFKSVSFYGSIDVETSVKIYIQYQGEEE